MKNVKNISAPYFSILIAAIALLQSCADPAQPVDNGTTVATSSFTGAEGNCTHGGIKLEFSRDGEIQSEQTQYICNGAQGQDGQNGQDGKKASILTMNFEGAQGNCSNGGVRVDILVDGQVQPDQTQYICNGANGQDGKDGQNIDGANGKTSSIKTTAFTDTQGTCTNGGVKVEVLIDDEVQADQTQYICNGANGQDGKDGQNIDGANGKTSSLKTTAFTGSQGSCTNGGVKFDVLIDGEVQADQTQYICNGANGQDGHDGQNGEDGKDGQNGHSALVTTSNEVGSNCANGGTRIDFGLDANDNGTLDTAEILSTRYVCNGANGSGGHDGQSGSNGQNTSLKTSAFTGAQGTCTNGGVKVDVLIDNEVQADQTQYICNGANGQDGQDGQNGSDGKNASIQTSTFTGAQSTCTNGGVKVDVLIDGVVQTGQTKYICNGANGQDGQDGQNGSDGKNASIQTTAFNGAQGNCINGGVKVDVLIDGVVQTGQTKYICNGANGQNGSDGKNASIQTTAFTGAQGTCTNGGVKVDVLIDGVVQTGQTKYICNGANGQNGEDGKDGQDGQNGSDGKNASIQTTAFNGAQGTCSNGGVKVEVLIDGVVQTEQTKYICNGANGQDGHDGQNGTDGKNASIQTTAFTGAQGSCTNGGVKVDVLIDGEVQTGQTKYICNGTNGQDGANGAALIICYDSQNIVDSRNDSANCGECGNVCQAGFECVNSTCQRIADMSTATIICNAKTFDPNSDLSHCGGCNVICDDVKTCKAGMCVTPSIVGDHIIFGRYEQDNISTNGKEPIEWRVLEIKNNKALLISEKALDVQPYYLYGCF